MGIAQYLLDFLHNRRETSNCSLAPLPANPHVVRATIKCGAPISPPSSSPCLIHLHKMGKIDSIVQHAPVRRISHHATLLLCFGIATLLLWQSQNIISWLPHHSTQALSPYLTFPRPDDPFQFMPCTADSILPELDDKNAARTWAARFDPEPAHWSWGNATRGSEHRGIYLCGYLDVSLDFTNASDPRIVRLAVSKYQVSGLARAGSTGTGRKSERTIVLNPGGPGGSGTNYLWRTAEQASERFSEGRFDVLGWDPRGELFLEVWLGWGS